jgi:MFS family permease
MRIVLPVIVISQFLCTSLWFAGNSVIADIAARLEEYPGFLAHLTSAIQFGFISGTLVFALLTISDRFSPSKVFFSCAILAAISNLALAIPTSSSFSILTFRFITGFFLAGIYPVGMKIASDHFREGLGRSLGYLVGALVLGTALPHALKSATLDLRWEYVIYVTSFLSVTGGSLIFFFVSDGRYRKPSQKLNFTALGQGFRIRSFRSAAFGYFGHMWELYTFWAFVPVILTTFNTVSEFDLNVPLISFLVIAAGAPACVLAGLLSQRFGAKKIATIALLISCICCLISPLLLFSSPALLLAFLLVWGVSVIADSPLFSTLIAQNAPAEIRGTSLTIVNCIGFAITIVSIQFLQFISGKIDPQYMYIFLSVGPILGLVALLKKS